MAKIQFENNNFVLYSPDSLNYITNDMEQILEKSLNLYKKIFNINDFRKVQINYFDNLDEFRNYIYELRGEKNSLPEYARGTFDNGMINGYIRNDIEKGSSTYNKKKYNASHELFHIMYKELVWEKNKTSRITWFDEGMAQFFSGENDSILNKNNFEEWFISILQKIKEIPNLNELNHGASFENEKYSGYNLSLLAVKYLFEKLGMDEFKKLIYDNEKIVEYGKTVVQDAINYYKNINRSW